MRTTTTALIAATLLVLAAPAFASGFCQSRSLNILLTNDDGFDSGGIQALRTSLTAAGHTVTISAPATNQSGSSAGLTLAAVTVANPESGVYAVGGSPATSVLLGVSNFFGGGQPQLIVSGINNGANIGPATVISGTVGAVTVGLTQYPKFIPGIAVSTDLPGGSSTPTSPENLAHFAAVAEFTARLVDRLVVKACDQNTGLLPWRTALNVNYPPIDPQAVSGVAVARQGRAPFFAIGYAPVGGNIYAPTFGPADPSPDVPGSDVVLFNQGYVTVVPIDGDFTASAQTRHRVTKLINGVQP
jgi:5'/3'-nucleotidase SurE